MLRIGEGAAFGGARRVKRNLDDAAFAGGEDGNFQQHVLVRRWINDGMMSGRFEDDVAVGIAWKLVLPWAEAVSAVPRAEVGSNGRRRLARIISLAGRPAVDI